MNRLILFGVFALASSAVGQPGEFDNRSAREAVALLAKQLKDALADRPPKVRLGTIAPQQGADLAFLANCGPELTQLLRDELRKLGVADDPSADFAVSATFIEAEDKRADRAADARQSLLIDLTLFDRVNKQKKEFSANVTNRNDVIRLLGLPVAIPPKASDSEVRALIKTEVDKHIANAPVKPAAALDGDKILPAPGSPFAIELLAAPAKPGGVADADLKPVKPAERGGLAFAPIGKEEVYAVRLHNSANFDAAVSLSIDGLSMFVAADKEFFEKGLLKVNFVIVPAGQSVLVRGWFVNLKQTDEFKVTAYADSLANAFKSTGTVGVVNARFHAAVKPGQPFPDGEPLDAGAFSQSADGTGRGARVASPYEKVERKIGLLRANVAVRYSKN